MKAKCPYCGGRGCGRCEKGIAEVTFAKGNVFTRRCLDPECGRTNGGYITELPFPLESSGACVECGGRTEWELIGESV